MPGEPGRSEHAMERGDKSVRKVFFRENEGGSTEQENG